MFIYAIIYLLCFHLTGLEALLGTIELPLSPLHFSGYHRVCPIASVYDGLNYAPPNVYVETNFLCDYIWRYGL